MPRDLLAEKTTRQPRDLLAGKGGHENVPEFKPVGVDGYDPETGEVSRSSLWDMAGAAITGAGDLPIIGPLVKSGTAASAAGIVAPFSEKDYGEVYDEMRGRQDQVMAENPGSALTGQVAGTIAGMTPLAATKLGGQLLGITGRNLLTRAGASAGTTATISGADTAARGGDVFDAAESALIGGGIGGAIPVIGTGLSAGLRAAGNRVAPLVNAVRDPASEASRRLGGAINANPGSVLTAADEQIARQNNIPLLNVDRGGEGARAVARSVANQSPEARNLIEGVASDRFAQQGARATEFVRKLAGGNVDDLGYQDLIRESARRANKPAYDRAFMQPSAQQMFTPELQELMQSPAVQKAARTATGRSANRGAVEGTKAVENPFHQAADGSFKLRRTADGRLVAPTLQFWDQVKRNLDSDIGKAVRAGDRPLSADLTALKSKLVGALDEAVPDYKTARQGAAAFFGAEDALEAGRKFAGTPRAIPEARRAFDKFTKPERQAFQTGYASELIDRIKATGDRTNVINSMFKSQASRESVELIFGPQKARELEAYVRVEDLVDRLRGAMGNSTTARQLVELGLGGTGGYLYTGDMSGAAIGAAAVGGARFAAGKANDRVLQRMGQLLTSDDPKAIQQAVTLASQVPGYMQALEKIGAKLAIPARAGGVSGQ